MVSYAFGVGSVPTRMDRFVHSFRASFTTWQRHDRLPDARLLGLRLSALMETLLFLGGVLMLDAAFGAGDRFFSMSLHPFWIIVLLITLQYGPLDALATALLASLFLLAFNLPEQNLGETLYELMLRTLTLPLLWVTVALAAGGVRSRQLRDRAQLAARVAQAETTACRMAEGYHRVKHAKEQLEFRLAGERCSLLTAYTLAKSLATADPLNGQVEIAGLLAEALNPVKFSLYRWNGTQLHLSSSHGWQPDDAYARHFASNHPLAECMQQGRFLCITDAADETLLATEGMLAGPIRDDASGRLLGMLKIEELPFQHFTVHTQETLRLVCHWIAHVYANPHHRKQGTDDRTPTARLSTPGRHLQTVGKAS